MHSLTLLHKSRLFSILLLPRPIPPTYKEVEKQQQADTNFFVLIARIIHLSHHMEGGGERELPQPQPCVIKMTSTHMLSCTDTQTTGERLLFAELPWREVLKKGKNKRKHAWHAEKAGEVLAMRAFARRARACIA
jgi:hypothetical protein